MVTTGAWQDKGICHGPPVAGKRHKKTPAVAGVLFFLNGKA